MFKGDSLGNCDKDDSPITCTAMTDKTKSLSYEDAGVSVERGNELIQRISTSAAKTRQKGVMSGLGGFGALFDLSSLNYKKPVLVSGTDGVGTKLKLAIETNRHDSIGIDLVAMCVNDLIVQGAKPLFFLDYFACCELDVDTASIVINGIARGCELAECALVGGETAEMPGMYSKGDYDLAGFCVGVVEKEEIIDGSEIKDGDSLIALASSGPHSNGYSLIRKLIDDGNISHETDIDGRSLIDCLLQPTRIYTKSILQLIKEVKINGLAHITGGGLTENIPRVLPENTVAELDENKIQLPAIFQWLQQQGNIETSEMYRTFNCGVGLVILVDPADEEVCINKLNELGEKAWTLGRIKKASNKIPAVDYLSL